jgi:hypothetical protein
MRPLLVLVLVVSLAGCGIAAKVSARNDMEQSKAAYKNCLAGNLQTPSNCEGYRLSYEADMKAYRAMSAGTQPGYNNTLTINHSNDE